MAKRFTRCQENFTCEQCGVQVTGDGYTNHCPNCLYGKHVDNFPGDRENQCGGLMEPISIEVKSDSYIITHHCTRCKVIRRNRTSENDSFDAILQIAQNTRK